MGRSTGRIKLRVATGIVACVVVTTLGVIAYAGDEPKTQRAAVATAAAAATASARPGPGASGAGATPAPAPRKPSRKKARSVIDKRMIMMRPPYSLGTKRIALTCGYHDSCKRLGSHYRAGDGLDWNDNNGTVPETRAVYFTASAHASRPARIGRVDFEFHPAARDRGYPCNTLIAFVFGADNRPLFRVMYQHVLPVRGLRSFYVNGGPGDMKVPNVVRRIGTMAPDPCPFFSQTADGLALMHAHVEPQWRAPYVGYTRNGYGDRRGRRFVPDVNGCGAACDGPVYPGPRWGRPWWELWTYRWTWTVDTRTNRTRR